MQILLDTEGILKYADFSLAKVEGENLEELFLKFAEAGEQWGGHAGNDIMKYNKCSGMKT